MIPRKIHFCWLSNDDYPPLIRHCLNTWKDVLPEYEIILWDTKRFNVNSISWVKEAYDAKKYAFAADYIRLYAVYTEGGVYLDSDVEVIKSFNDLLQYKSFIGFEAATGGIEAAIFGGEPGTPWCKKAMDFYENEHFHVNEKGGVDLKITAPNIIEQALKDTYGSFSMIQPIKPMNLDNDILICPAHYFSPIKYDVEKCYNEDRRLTSNYRANPETYCIHRFNAAWGIKPSKSIQLWDKYKKRLTAVLGERIVSRLLSLLKIFK